MRRMISVDVLSAKFAPLEPTPRSRNHRFQGCRSKQIRVNIDTRGSSIGSTDHRIIGSALQIIGSDGSAAVSQRGVWDMMKEGGHSTSSAQTQKPARVALLLQLHEQLAFPRRVQNATYSFLQNYGSSYNNVAWSATPCSAGAT